MQEVLIQNLHEPLEAVYLKFAYKRRHFGSSLVTTPPTHSMTKSCSFQLVNCVHTQEQVVDMMWRMALARWLDWSISLNFFSILGFWVHLIVFGV